MVLLNIMIKYLSVRDHLLDVIDGLAVGAALPAERQLCDDLSVSRVTVRRALDELSREGRVERRQGAGTFVSAPKTTVTPRPHSFTKTMRAQGLTPSSRTLDAREVLAGARLGTRLSISPGELVLVFRRLRLVNDEPIALETLHVPSSLAPGLTGRDLEKGSFYDLLRDRYGVQIDSGTQTVEASVTDQDESTLLGVPPLSPAFLFELVTRAVDGMPVEFVRGLHRGDRLKLVLGLAATWTDLGEDLAAVDVQLVSG